MALTRIYNRLLAEYGPQHWWPGDTPFEVMVGAVLTQNTAWTNVERAIHNLKQAQHLDARAIHEAPVDQLADWLRPSGYFNIKARRLKNFCAWYLASGALPTLTAMDTATLRGQLLSVNGVGPETADDILLYAFQRPVFVVDAYTKRIFSRVGVLDEALGYELVRAYFEAQLAQDVAMFNEYHALIVRHGKDVCRPKPRCDKCCLRALCKNAA